MPTSLTNPDCLAFLEHYKGSYDEHLNIDQVGLYIDALWDFNWKTVLHYNLIQIVQFGVLILTVCLLPVSELMFTINAVVALLLILNESRQICKEGTEYFSEPFNYLDLSGNIFVIISIINLKRVPGEAFYDDSSCKRCLIGAVLLVGLRAYSNLRIFESYRVQIQVFKQIFVDIVVFMSILMMLNLLMAVVYGIEFANHKEDGVKNKPSSIGLNFFANFGLFYQFMVGENPYGDAGDMSATGWLVYVT